MTLIRSSKVAIQIVSHNFKTRTGNERPHIRNIQRYLYTIIANDFYIVAFLCELVGGLVVGGPNLGKRSVLNGFFFFLSFFPLFSTLTIIVIIEDYYSQALTHGNKLCYQLYE